MLLNTSLIIPIASYISDSLIIRGGVNLIMCSCVGFASNPLSRSMIHISQALILFIGSVTTALRSPLPRTCFIILWSMRVISLLNISPIRWAFSASFSSFTNNVDRVACYDLHKVCQHGCAGNGIDLCRRSLACEASKEYSECGQYQE